MKRRATHATFTIERLYNVPPERVFRAFQNPEAKAQWFIGGDGWQELERRDEFTVGGEERLLGRWSDGTVTDYRARYEEIVPNERIIFSYRMWQNEVPISVSLATVQFHDSNGGTNLTYTEQLTCLDGFEDPSGKEREHGTRLHLERIESWLHEQAVAQ